MIIKTILYFITLFVITFFVVHGMQNVGVITLDWFDYTIEINSIFALFIILFFVFLVQIMMHIMTTLGFLPSVIKYKRQAAKFKSGLENLKAISLQLSLGNQEKAKKLASKTSKIIPQYPIFDEILQIKSKNDLSNDFLDLRMAKNKVDEFLANYKDDKALKIVENILQEHPKSAWAIQKQYHILLKLEEFNYALNILDILLKEKLINKVQYKIEKSFIHYEMAIQEMDPIEALQIAEVGLKNRNDFIKLLEISALILQQEQETEKSLKLIMSLAKQFNQALLSFDLFKHIVQNLPTDEQSTWLNKFYKLDKSLVGCQLAKVESFILQNKTDDAIKFLEEKAKANETLLVLSNIYKEKQDDKNALKYLEASQAIAPLHKGGLIAEYSLWQENSFEVNKNEDNNHIESANEQYSMLMKKDEIK
ncbi:MAG: hypothetical protein GY793_06100 [Proteobacteria bacterium]|nr:hypothetical protein [Pseudomonadota bacterium]